MTTIADGYAEVLARLSEERPRDKGIGGLNPITKPAG